MKVQIPFSILFFFFFFFFFSSSLAQLTIEEIHLKVSDEDNAEMDDDIFMSFTNNDNSDACETPSLDSTRDDYVRGEIDTYHGSQLGGCLGFDLGPRAFSPFVTMRHEGEDGLSFDWVRILLSDDRVVYCREIQVGTGTTTTLDNDDAIVMSCSDDFDRDDNDINVIIDSA